MAKQHSVTLKCPACGKESVFQATDFADLDLAADSGAVMELSLFQHTCPDCGGGFPVRFPMLCASRELNLAVCLLTDRSQLDTLADSVRSGSGMRLRAVLSPDRLRELILIFRNGLDDRAVVLTEMAMKKTMADNHVKVLELYFTGTEDTESGKVLLFHAVLAEGDAKNASWPASYYEKMREEFTADLPEPSRYMVLDETWARSLLSFE